MCNDEDYYYDVDDVIYEAIRKSNRRKKKNCEKTVKLRFTFQKALQNDILMLLRVWFTQYNKQITAGQRTI